MANGSVNRAGSFCRVAMSLCLVGLIACESGLDSTATSDFAIYRLKDSKLAASQVWAQPIEELVLADVPFVTARDLKSYAWQTHEFRVTAEVDSQLVLLKRTPGPVGGIPFVVTVGNERIYLGAFWYAYSSLAPQMPFIDVILDEHRICRGWIDQGDDKRNDRRIYDALKRARVLTE